MNKESRLEAFEKMLEDVRKRYDFASERMEELKPEGKEKTATFRQLMGDKITYKNILLMYKTYGLTDDKEK